MFHDPRDIQSRHHGTIRASSDWPEWFNKCVSNESNGQHVFGALVFDELEFFFALLTR
jgi:hypothetical protein